MSYHLPIALFTTGIALNLILHRLRRDNNSKNKKSRIPIELSNTFYTRELNEAIKLPLICGSNMVQALNNVDKDIEYKGTTDFVTETDKLNEVLIFNKLHEIFPTYNFIGEESVADNNNELPPLTDKPTWIVDPIDGTTNFVHSLPLTCVSIGLVVNKISVMGAVYIPAHGELFTVVRGHGAYLNGRRLHVSKATAISQSLLVSSTYTFILILSIHSYLMNICIVCDS